MYAAPKRENFIHNLALGHFSFHNFVSRHVDETVGKKRDVEGSRGLSIV